MAKEDENNSGLSDDEKRKLEEIRRRAIEGEFGEQKPVETGEVDESKLSPKEKVKFLLQRVTDRLFVDPERTVTPDGRSTKIERVVPLDPDCRLTVCYVLNAPGGVDYAEGFLYPNAFRFLPPSLSVTQPNQADAVLKVDGSLSVASGFPITHHFMNDPVKPREVYRKPNTISFETAYNAAKRIFGMYINPPQP